MAPRHKGRRSTTYNVTLGVGIGVAVVLAAIANLVLVGPLAMVTMLLAGAGTAVVAATRMIDTRDVPEEDLRRQDVLVMQSIVVLAMGTIIQVIWGPLVTAGPPLAVTLAGIATAVMAAESSVIFLRAPRRAPRP